MCKTGGSHVAQAMKRAWSAVKLRLSKVVVCTWNIKPHKVLQLSLLSPAGRREFGHERALYGQESNSQTPGRSRAGSGPVPIQT